jgi:unsaturated rhamnogalacturonyl hydrolase
MALVDTLDFVPTNHPSRHELIGILQKLSRALVKYQDPKTGLWYQVLDQGGREGNYLEATASSMFVYSLAKGINRGYLPNNLEAPLRKGYDGITSKLIRTDGQGRISLTQCCSVAGLGYGRDGSYAYYLKEPIVDNDLKGVGPFILAGIELQKLSSPSAAAPKSDKVQAAPESKPRAVGN